MWLLLRTVIVLPMVVALAVVVLLAIGLRVACQNLVRERPCIAF
jgi:hypothetical protein